MAKFKVTINTFGYKPCGDFSSDRVIYAMDNWTSIEHSYLEVLFRLRTFIGCNLSAGERSKWGDKYEKWLNKKNNRIIINDDWYSVKLPYCSNGHINCDKLVKQLKEKGRITIEFLKCFDIRENRSNFKNCYMEIVKE